MKAPTSIPISIASANTKDHSGLLAHRRPAGIFMNHLRDRDAADAKIGHQQCHFVVGVALDQDVGRFQVAEDDGWFQMVGNSE